MSRGREEVVIVGGGLAGASAASTLADAGRPVLVIERDAEARHKVCGEFLSIEAQTYLSHLGIDLDAVGASRISRLRLVRKLKLIEVELPFVARGLSRRVLDEALLREAEARGARILRGRAVRSISTDHSGVAIDMGPGDSIAAGSVLLASGKHDVRGVKRTSSGAMNDLIGFKLHYRMARNERQDLDGAVEVILFRGGYAGLQMVEQDIANLCLVVSRQRFEQVGKNWDDLLSSITDECPHLGERLQCARALFERPLSIFQIPYGFLHGPDRDEPQGLFRLGDQVGVIPSFTGEGMSIALHSGCLAASIYLDHGQAASIFHHRVRSDIGRSIRLASTLNSAVRHAAGQQAIFRLSRLWPGAMRHVAALTRVQEASMHNVLFAS
ncbi:NAD(P)/FAD-dependent oxidoreductase [Microvirga lotononidis]|uniref:Flavin-dependent dehydrogenase n=1 Tax=Microvirga lotononidis TaxID=864069 RepID=I4YY55_9HYPH|nr:FAD-dependent monooxygenase [Microvirga lotononidis]EIM28897.1 flavin-dependent dehydrogenase [Microvirga lotononidis]WQO26817.1 NAD-binding protein [Microvirga lotononidis]